MNGKEESSIHSIFICSIYKKSITNIFHMALWHNGRMAHINIHTQPVKSQPQEKTFRLATKFFLFISAEKEHYCNIILFQLQLQLQLMSFYI